MYEDFYENKNLLDFSDYPEKSNFFDSVYRKVVDKMNDEIKEKINGEFNQLKLKISLLIINNQDIKKPKGVNKNAVKNTRH